MAIDAHPAGSNPWWPRLASPLLVAGVTLTSMAVYVATLAPGLTFQHYGADGGDLIAAARTLGVPHPTGYPTYTLLAWLFTHLPVGTIAYRVNLLSAVCAAAASGVLCASLRTLLSARPFASAIAVAGALSLAFAPLLWSQAVISEVYALLTLFAALLLWLLVRWRQGGGNHLLLLAGLTLGLGLGNHLTLAAILPAIPILLWTHRRRWLLRRVLLPAAALLALGLAVYLYLPVAASRYPPVNWGDPRTWNRFLWVVTASQYRTFAFGLPPTAFLGRLHDWAGLLGGQFGWWGLAIALVGLRYWFRLDKPFAWFSLTWSILIAIYAFAYDVSDSHVYLLPGLMLMVTWWALGAQHLLLLVRRLRPRQAWLAVALIASLPAVSLALHWQESDLSGDWSAHTYSHRLLDDAEPHALLIVRGDRPTFAAWYAVYAEGRRNDVAVVNGPLLAYVWYRQHLRSLYPELILAEPGPESITTDDLVRELVVGNIQLRPIDAADPGEAWKEWFDFVPQGSGTLFQVRFKPTVKPQAASLRYGPPRAPCAGVASSGASSGPGPSAVESSGRLDSRSSCFRRLLSTQ